MKKKAIQNAKVGKYFWPVIEMCMQIMQITGMPKNVDITKFEILKTERVSPKGTFVHRISFFISMFL